MKASILQIFIGSYSATNYKNASACLIYLNKQWIFVLIVDSIYMYTANIQSHIIAIGSRIRGAMAALKFQGSP